MNERLTTRDLAELLANQTGLDKKRAEDFIETLSSYFAQSLERNKVVKILGLGVFKIVLVSERESVHIQTGERFIIPAHHKLAFVPDKDFKEQINRPFALFEPIEATESEMLALKSQETESSDDDEMTYPETVASTETETETVGEGNADDLSKYGEYQDTVDDYLETPVASTSQIQDDAFDDETPVASTSQIQDDAFDDETPVASTSQIPDNVFNGKTPAASASQILDDVFDDETPEQNAFADENLYDEDYYISEDTSDAVNEDASYEEEEVYPEHVTYENESEPFAYTNDTANERQTPVPENKNDETSDDESNVARYSLFTPGKKGKTAFKWLFSLMALLCLTLGGIIGTYMFLQHNTEKTAQMTQGQGVSNVNAMTGDDASMSTDLTSDSVGEQTELPTTPETPDNGMSNNATGETPVTGTVDNTLATPNDGNRSENNPSDTGVTRRQEITPVTNWIAPSPENTRTGTGTRRADGPNREIEERNRALLNTRQSSGGNAARTTANANTPASTANNANAKKLPTSIKMPAGSTLTQIALEYYGDKIFWVYIYEHNKSRIGTDPKDFERVPTGLELQLPAPQTYGIDAKSSASRERARQKQAQLMK